MGGVYVDIQATFAIAAACLVRVAPGFMGRACVSKAERGNRAAVVQE